MIRMIIFLSLMVVAQSILAKQRNVEIDSRIVVNGKPIGAPRILTNDGEKAKILVHDQQQNRGYNLVFHPFFTQDGHVLLKYSLAVKEKNNETLSRGQVSVPLEKDSKISIDKGKILIHFKVKKS